jgi:hypothetical protein
MDYEEVQLAGDGELFIKSPYQAWRTEETKVISYVLIPPRRAEEQLLPIPTVRQGWRTATWARDARAEVRREFGQILEENAAGDNVFFRVYKEKQ